MVRGIRLVKVAIWVIKVSQVVGGVGMVVVVGVVRELRCYWILGVSFQKLVCMVEKYPFEIVTTTNKRTAGIMLEGYVGSLVYFERRERYLIWKFKIG